MASSIFIGFLPGVPYSTSGSTVTFTGSVGATTGFLAGDGLVGTPSYSFAADTTKGLYSSATNEIGVAIGGVKTFALDTNNFYLLSNASTIYFGAALDVQLARLAADVVAVGAGDAYGLAAKAFINTAPTIASGFGTTPAIVASNGTAAFTVNVGTGGTASNGVITMPAATTGWIAHVENLTGTLGNYANQRTVQIASTTTSITLENQTISTGAALAWTASDVLVVTCVAY